MIADARTEAAVLEILEDDHQETHPYRMTMVCEKRDGRWLLLQVHGSSPHHG